MSEERKVIVRVQSDSGEWLANNWWWLPAMCGAIGAVTAILVERLL